MSFKHFTLPVPSEMQFLDASIWDLPEDHISIHSQEAYQLGFVRTSWNEQSQGAVQATVTPPTSSPEETLHLTPLITHSSTWKRNSPSPPSPPAPTADTLAIIGNTRTASSNYGSMESYITDRWTNSQSSHVEKSPQNRAGSSQRTPSLDHNSGGSHCDTSFSTAPPLTPPPSSFPGIERIEGSPAEFANAFGSPSPTAGQKPPQNPKAPDRGGLGERDGAEREGTLGVEVEVRTPESLSPQLKKASRSTTPSPPATLDNSPARPPSFEVNINDEDSDVVMAEGDPLDVLASLAAMRSSAEVEDVREGEAGVPGIRYTELEREMQDGGNQVDDKRWLLEQTGPIRSRPTQPFRDTSPYRAQPPNLPDEAGTIPSSEIPGSKHISPAKSTSSSDLTTESEGTPRIDSRTRRAREREARRLAKAGRGKEGSDEEEFTPGPRGRARSIGLQLKQRFINGETIDRSVSFGDEMEMARGLLAFGARGRREDTEEDEPIEEPASMSVVLPRLGSIAEEPTSSLASSADLPGPAGPSYGRGKTAGKPPTAASGRRTSNLSRFIAPTPLKRDTPSLPDSSVPDGKSTNSKVSRKRKLSDENAEVMKEDEDDEDYVPQKKTKSNPAPAQAVAASRIPLALLQQPVKFISISEAAKLRRSKAAAGNLSQESASTSASTSTPPPPSQTKTKAKITAKKVAPVKKPVVVVPRIHNTRAASGSPGRRKGARKSMKEESEPEESEVEEEEEEEQESSQGSGKSGGKKNGKISLKRGKDRIYAEEEKTIMLEAWDGIQPLTKVRLRECAAKILEAGHGIRTPEALKWYMKNTLWPRYAETYGRPKKRDLSGWRTASDGSGGSSQQK